MLAVGDSLYLFYCPPSVSIVQFLVMLQMCSRPFLFYFFKFYYCLYIRANKDRHVVTVQAEWEYIICGHTIAAVAARAAVKCTL